MNAQREYSIPIGTLIRRCSCGARIVHLAAADKETGFVTVEYSGGQNFDYWGVEHSCDGQKAQPEEVSKSKAEPLKPVAKGELRAAFCKGSNCGKIIYFRKTESGLSAPVNANATPHWATCEDDLLIEPVWN